MIENEISKIHVLVADDSPTIHKAVRLTLPSEEFEITMANNGKEALAFVQSHGVDIILADVNMPEMDGYELSHAIKVRLSKTDLPVILMCGTFDKFDQDKFIGCKANHRIWKPFETSVFLDVLRQFVPGIDKATTPTDQKQHVIVSGRESQKTDHPPKFSDPPRNVISQAEPINIPFQVESAVLQWLETIEGRKVFEHVVRREVDRILHQFEQELAERIKQEAWDSSAAAEGVTVYHPRQA